MYQELRDAWSALTAPGSHFEVAERLVRGRRLRGYKNALRTTRHLWLQHRKPLGERLSRLRRGSLELRARPPRRRANRALAPAARASARCWIPTMTLAIREPRMERYPAHSSGVPERHTLRGVRGAREAGVCVPARRRHRDGEDGGPEPERSDRLRVHPQYAHHEAWRRQRESRGELLGTSAQVARRDKRRMRRSAQGGWAWAISGRLRRWRGAGRRR